MSITKPLDLHRPLYFKKIEEEDNSNVKQVHHMKTNVNFSCEVLEL